MSEKLVDPEEEKKQEGETLTLTGETKTQAPAKTYAELRKEREQAKEAIKLEQPEEEKKEIHQMKTSKVRIFDREQQAEIAEIKESDEFN